MQWLSDLWSPGDRFLQIAVLTACGIAVLVALAIVYRVVFAHRLRVPGGRTRQPRLGLVDAFSLDGQRQLVLVRRDNVEHLVMIGGPNDVLIEAQINRALAAPRETGLSASGPAAPAAAPAPATPVRRRSEPAPVAQTPSTPATAPAAAASAPSAAAPPAEAQPIPIRPAGNKPEPAHAAAVALQAPDLAVEAKPEAAPGGARPALSPTRRTMPPPITPLGRANANVARLPEKAAPAAALSGPAPPAVEAAAPLQAAKVETSNRTEPARPARTEPAPQASASSGGVAAPVVQAAPAGPGPVRVDARPQASRLEPAQTVHAPDVTAASTVEGRAPGAQGAPTHPAPPGPAPAVPTPADRRANAPEDPLAGLDSLEAEMAKLLGREKLG